jgi:hypothetical protein
MDWMMIEGDGVNATFGLCLIPPADCDWVSVCGARGSNQEGRRVNSPFSGWDKTNHWLIAAISFFGQTECPAKAQLSKNGNGCPIVNTEF